jgi:hypothetical protein
MILSAIRRTSIFIVVEYKKKPKICQMQIKDYIDEFIRDYYPMWIPKYYQRARKRFASWLSVRPYKKHVKEEPKLPNNTNYDYIPEHPPISLPKAPYLRRFYSLPKYSYDEFAYKHISRKEWDLIQLLPDFTGYFIHIFELNDLSFFDDLQERLEKDGNNFKGIFLYDIVAISLFQRFLGIEKYSELERLSFFLHRQPLTGIVHDEFFFPSAKDISWVAKGSQACEI